ncbi:MAG: GntR family transcriptional regulator, partial [Chitinivibrionales bacterium]|nr:GntR family transcriptional regulator [Chitinivibrionales bacterium]
MQESAASRALRHAQAVVARLKRTGTAKLPTLAQLAAQAEVSHVTTHRVLAGLREQGIISSRRGSGYYLNEPLSSPKTAAKLSAADRTAQKLRRDLLSGALARTGPLPRRKELCSRYGVAYATLQKALDSLCRQGIIHADGATLAPRRLRRHASASIVQVGVAGRLYMTLPDKRIIDDNLSLENTCARWGIGIRKLIFSHRRGSLLPDGPFPMPPYREKDLEGILGFIVMSRGMQE